MSKLIGKYLNAWGTLQRANYVTPLTKKEIKIVDNYPATSLKATTDYYTSAMKSVDNDVTTVEANRQAAEKAKASVTPTPVKSRVPLISRSEQRQLDLDKNNKMLELLRQFGYTGKLDGILGSGAKRAMAEAERQGYNWDNVKGLYVKPEVQVSQETFIKPKTIAEEDLSKSLNDFKWNSIGSYGNLLGNLGAYVHSKSPLGYVESKLIQRSFDNMYPYSYGDKMSNGETYMGQELPEGVTLKQVSANDDASTQLEGIFGKIWSSVKGKDPRRLMMEDLANIDLNTDEGRNLWNELSKKARAAGVIRTNNPENDQWEMRARLDNMNLYAGRPLLWNSYVINDSYESPTAKSHGMPTYRIADEKLRARINGEMVNFWMSHPEAIEEKTRADGSKYYVMQNMGYLGNQSMVADSREGLNLRNGDWWDYIANNQNGYRVYTGDRLVPEGLSPTRRNGYGIGHNHAHMTESTDNLFANAAKEYMGYDTKDENILNLSVGSLAWDWTKNKIGLNKNGGKLIARIS